MRLQRQLTRRGEHRIWPRMKRLLPIALALAFTACAHSPPEPVAPATQVRKVVKLDSLTGVARMDFNRRAAELSLPLFWRTDANQDGALNVFELGVLWGVGEGTRALWIDDQGAFTDKMTKAHQAIGASSAAVVAGRDKLVLEELAQGRPTLVETDLSKASTEDKAMVAAILQAAQGIESIYAKQNGVFSLADQIPAQDTASRALFHRNQGPFCEAPKTQQDPECSALVSKPKKISGLYPANLQNGTDTKFCAVLEKRKDADKLLHQFVVVRAKEGGKSEGNAATDELVAVPYHEAFKADAEIVSALLHKAAAAVVDVKEAPLKAYLLAAAQAFLDDTWETSDEAWAAMNASNSKWYLRIGPDETYFEPCSRKAGFHVSFARINQDSLEWQNKLEPVKAELEKALAALAGPPYQARDVQFHLPDFIDIVINAGDSRDARGATIGQSLPNWGPVADGRGRTVAMTNLYTDKDSELAWTEGVSSLFCQETMDKTTFDAKLAIMSTVLHEAAHNLGPAHEYKVKGKTDDQIFGGARASMLEELKAQTAALYLSEWLVDKGIVDAKSAQGAHLRDVTWAFGHIAQGMYTPEGKPQAYSQLASIQMGTLFKNGALAWNAAALAANGKDKGCFRVDLAKWNGVVDELAKVVMGVKGRGDKALADQLVADFVDDTGDWSKLRETIRERWLRLPKASFVYAVKN